MNFKGKCKIGILATIIIMNISLWLVTNYDMTQSVLLKLIIFVIGIGWLLGVIYFVPVRKWKEEVKILREV